MFWHTINNVLTYKYCINKSVLNKEESSAKAAYSYVSTAQCYSTKIVSVDHYFVKYVNADSNVQGEKQYCFLFFFRKV